MKTTKQISDNQRRLKKENPFYIFYLKTTESLNNEYYVTKLAIEGLSTLRDKLKSEAPFTLEIEVPSINGLEIKKEKDKSKVVNTLKKSIKSDLYANSLGTGVSLLEHFFEDVIRTILLMHPGKLSVDIGTGTRKDAQEDKKIDLKDIIAAKSLEEVYLSIINQKIFKLFYASPSDYFKYIGEGMQIKLDQDLVLNYIEIKATRDLIVHNKGKVNDIYIQKAGIKARAKDTKQNIPITLEYHISSYSILKKIVRETYESVSGHYLKLTKKSQLYSTKA